MQSTRITYWDQRARRQFSYQADNAKTTAQNKWTSYGDRVLAGSPYAGNCSDLVSTFLDLACRDGLDLTAGYRMDVLDEQRGLGHQIGCVVDDDGNFWIVGDTFYPGPYHAEMLRHKPFNYNRLSEGPDLWRSGAPFKLEKI